MQPVLALPQVPSCTRITKKTAVQSLQMSAQNRVLFPCQLLKRRTQAPAPGRPDAPRDARAAPDRTSGSASIDRRRRDGLPLHDHHDADDESPDQPREGGNDRDTPSGSGVETSSVGPLVDRGNGREVKDGDGVGHPAGPPGQHSSGQGRVTRRCREKCEQNAPYGTEHEQVNYTARMSHLPHVGQLWSLTRITIGSCIEQRASGAMRVVARCAQAPPAWNGLHHSPSPFLMIQESKG